MRGIKEGKENFGVVVKYHDLCPRYFLHMTFLGLAPMGKHHSRNHNSTSCSLLEEGFKCGEFSTLHVTYYAFDILISFIKLMSSEDVIIVRILLSDMFLWPLSVWRAYNILDKLRPIWPSSFGFSCPINCLRCCQISPLILATFLPMAVYLVDLLTMVVVLAFKLKARHPSSTKFLTYDFRQRQYKLKATIIKHTTSFIIKNFKVIWPKNCLHSLRLDSILTVLTKRVVVTIYVWGHLFSSMGWPSATLLWLGDNNNLGMPFILR